MNNHRSIQTIYRFSICSRCWTTTFLQINGPATSDLLKTETISVEWVFSETFFGAAKSEIDVECT